MKRPTGGFVVTRRVASSVCALSLLLSGCTFFGVGPGAQVDPAPGKDACRLLTPKEVEHVTGHRVSGTFHGDFKSDCVWGFEGGSYQPPDFVGVEVSYSDHDDFTATLADARQGHPHESATSVAGLGDQAYLLTNGAAEQLWVLHHSTVLVIAVSLALPTMYSSNDEKQLAALSLARI